MTEAGRTVYLLGAGFSKSVASEMPLMDTLGDKVLKILRLEPSTIEPFGYDLEVWLSHLATIQPWIDESTALRNRAQFLDVTEAVHDVISYQEFLARKNLLPMGAARLIWHMSRHESTALTFNYDLIVERLALSFGAGNRFSNLYDAPLAERRTIGSSGGFLSPDPPQFNTMTLYKLHGSVNWYTQSMGQPDRSDVFLSMNKGGWVAPGEYEPWVSRRPDRMSDLAPFVIPPVASKTDFYANSLLRSQWRASAEALQRAERLVVIGYSFPASDIQVKTFLSTNLDSEAVVEVVDPSDQVAKTLRQLLHRDVDHVARSVDEYAELFAPDVVEWGSQDWYTPGLRRTVWINGSPRQMERSELLALLRQAGMPDNISATGRTENSFLETGADLTSPFRDQAHLAFVKKS